MKGLIISIEGIDQSGKSTQTKLLIDKLKEQGHQVESISFPNYSTAVGREIEAFLAGERFYNVQTRHMLLSVNRWEHKDEIENWINNNKMVVLNRYSGSNYAYGVVQGLDLDWLLNLEKGLPAPDLTVLIDLSPETSIERKTSDRDLHEQNQEFLGKVRQEYLKMAEQWGWRVIDGGRDISTVQELIWQEVKNFYQSNIS